MGLYLDFSWWFAQMHNPPSTGQTKTKSRIILSLLKSTNPKQKAAKQNMAKPKTYNPTGFCGRIMESLQFTQ